jgi:hypothetical protein
MCVTLMCLWAIYIFQRSVCLFCCRKICGPILGIYKSHTDIWMHGNWDWGRAIPFLGIHKWDFSLQYYCRNRMFSGPISFLFCLSAQLSLVYNRLSHMKSCSIKYNLSFLVTLHVLQLQQIELSLSFKWKRRKPLAAGMRQTFGLEIRTGLYWWHLWLFFFLFILW